MNRIEELEGLLRECRKLTLENDSGRSGVLRGQIDAALSPANAGPEQEDEESPQPRIQFGAYGVELTSTQWDQIHQSAFELGGTDDGGYHLEPEDLNDLVSQVFVILGFTDEYTDNVLATSQGEA